MDRSPADLRVSEDRNAKRDGWSERVLLGGLFLEVALLLVFSKDKPWYETASVIFANFLVFAGVAGEAYFGGKAKVDAKELQRLSDEAIALANLRADEAKERVAKAEQETQELKARYAWRRVIPEKEQLLRHWLSQFQNGSVVIRWFMYDIESNNFAEDFGAIFRLSGWKTRFSPEAYTGNFAYGLRVSTVRAGSIAEKTFNDSAAIAVMTAFTNSFVEFEPLPPPEPHMMAGDHGDFVVPPCAELYVGPRWPIAGE